MMTKKNNLFILVAFFCCLPVSIVAQNDTAFNDLQKEFGDFQHEATSEFQTFLSENDSLFLKFLEQSWKEFEMYELERDEKPKPVTQPVLNPSPNNSRHEIDAAPKKSRTVRVVEREALPQVAKPAEYESMTMLKSFHLFGAGFSMQYAPGRITEMETISEKNIRQFYQSFSGQTALWDSNISGLMERKAQYRFNDWGYYLVLKEAAKQIYPRQREQTLFVWFAMIKSGYQVKIGYAGDKLYLLIPSLQELYNIPYLSDQELKYYLFGADTDPVEEITTYSGFYNNTARIFSFTFVKLPTIENTGQLTKSISYKKKAIHLTFQKGLIDYLSSMPQSDLDMYYQVPLSDKSLRTLDMALSPMLQGKSDRQKVDLLLEFIQTAIPYKADREQFGSERYMFAEECLYYRGADCEDRTVLLKQLVEHYTGLPMASLEFQNHVTLAVHFTDAVYGDHVISNEKAYSICDPTFINARVGMLPADLKDKRSDIRVLE